MFYSTILKSLLYLNFGLSNRVKTRSNNMNGLEAVESLWIGEPPELDIAKWLMESTVVLLLILVNLVSVSVAFCIRVK